MEHIKEDTDDTETEETNLRFIKKFLKAILIVLLVYAALWVAWLVDEIEVELLTRMDAHAATVPPEEVPLYEGDEATIEMILMLEEFKREQCRKRGEDFLYACLRWYPRPRDADIPKSAPYTRGAFPFLDVRRLRPSLPSSLLSSFPLPLKLA